MSYPSLVEHQWFNILMKYINPLYKRLSRSTIKCECIKMFILEKEKIKKVFESIVRISLTIDCCIPNRITGYMCLTVHFIDFDWQLQKHIISFNELTPSNKCELMSMLS